MSEKLQFRLALLAALCAVVAAWFFLHPNSPWHERRNYFILFPEIGTLKPGDRVQISGIPKGKVVQTRLLDDGVEVEVAVLANAHVPAGCRIRIVNAGLMGQREVEFLLPQIPVSELQELPDGAKLRGGFDAGSTRLVQQASALIKTVEIDIRFALASLDSTLLDPALPDRIHGIARKGNRMIGKANLLTNAAKDTLSAVATDLDTLRTRLLSLQEGISTGLDSLAQGFAQADSSWASTQTKLKTLSGEVRWIGDQLAKTDNSAGAMLGSPEFHSRLKSTSEHAQALLNGITSEGLHLNVDF